MRFFNRIKLLTPESVELEFTLAGIGSRALALLVDYNVLAAILVVFWIVWGILADQLLKYLSRLQINYSAAPIWLLAIAFLINFAIYIGYFIFFEVFWQGQTPGKRFAKIRVIRDNGRLVGLPQAILRTLLRSVDDFLFIGVFFIFLGRQEKRIGDWVAGTVVVQEDRPLPRTTVTISDAAKALSKQLPQLTNLSQLLPDDFAVISEYLHRRGLMESKARSDLSLKLARQTRSVVQLDAIPSGLTSDQFLEAIYLAYQEQFPAY